MKQNFYSRQTQTRIFVGDWGGRLLLTAHV